MAVWNMRSAADRQLLRCVNPPLTGAARWRRVDDSCDPHMRWMRGRADWPRDRSGARCSMAVRE